MEWASREQRWVKDLSHMLHLNGFTPEEGKLQELSIDGFITQVGEAFSATDMFLIGEEELSTAKQHK